MEKTEGGVRGVYYLLPLFSFLPLPVVQGLLSHLLLWLFGSIVLWALLLTVRLRVSALWLIRTNSSLAFAFASSFFIGLSLILHWTMSPLYLLLVVIVVITLCPIC